MKHLYFSLLLLLAVCVENVNAQDPVDPRTVIPTGDWEVLGDGTYYEDVFFMDYHWEKGASWTVTVEESVEQPGWYRFIAYGDACPKAIIEPTFGEPDNESYMYINATDPDKAFIPICSFGNKFNICSYVLENDFDPSKYLTVNDGVISGSEGCIVYQLIGAGDRWKPCNFFENFKLVLPESEWKDYRFKIKAEKSCSEDNIFKYEITNVGPDLKSFKAYVKPGYFSGTEAEISEAYANGENVAEGKNTCTATARGRYSLIVIGCNEAGEAASANSTYFYVMDDEADQWESVGTAVYYEDVLGSLYPDMTTEKLNVEVEVNKNRPGYYRLVEPYKEHPYFLYYIKMYRPHENHKHYLYVNAEDPKAVYIEDSPAGVNLGYGDASILSMAYVNLCNGMSKEEISALNLFGELSGREITFPDNSLVLVERLYKEGMLVTAEAPMFRITLPESAGIDDITVDNDAPAEYFNLQGVRVDNPSNGVFIRRQGTKTEKVIIK